MHRARRKTKEHLLDGVSEMLVLRLLAHEEIYGYGLVSEIQRRSEGAFEFGEGSASFTAAPESAGDAFIHVRFQ
jgi:hypothetical protein